MRTLTQSNVNTLSARRKVAVHSLTLAGLLVVGLAPVLPGNSAPLGSLPAWTATRRAPLTAMPAPPTG